MAESVLFGIAGMIVDFLVPRALEKVGKPWGVKHELEKLRDTVSTLQAVLEDAEQRSDQNRQIQVGCEELKDAFYEAQDVVEEFNIEAIRRELRGHSEVMKQVSTFSQVQTRLLFS
ncbi:uncharacterized protein J3R85_000090 [Psidium guajava]|nr:uncharacterized protein J3R85_000090 [Psidium guajava]